MKWLIRYAYLCTCCFVLVNAQAADSVVVRGFWQRYTKQPSKVLLDSTWEQKQAAESARRVRFVYDVDFASYFDNREYKSDIQFPQTIFSFRLSPSIGVQIRDKVGGKHKLLAGVRYTQPLGGNWKNANVIPTAYYHYSNYGVNLQLGAVPYENRILSMPDWLQYDSIAYIRSNVQGALISYQDKRGYVEFMCDWRSARDSARREMFRILLNGQYQYKWFFIGGLIHMNHVDCSADPEIQYRESLYDDVNWSAYVGLNFSQLTPLDSLALKVSYIGGIANARAWKQMFIPQGTLIELYLNWWFLGIKNTTYVGDNLQPLRFSKDLGRPIGNQMCQGDPFYQARFYNRTDIFAYLYRSSFVNCYLSYNLHYQGGKLQHQQQVIVRFNLGGLLEEEKRGTMLRGLFDK